MMPVRDPVKDAEIEIVCPCCDYRMTRTPNRLRRETDIACPQCGHEFSPAVTAPGTGRRSGALNRGRAATNHQLTMFVRATS